MPTDVVVIKLIPSFILRKREVSPSKKKQTTNKYKKQTNKTKQNRTSYPLPHAFMEDTARHNIAQMTSTSKTYIPCLLVLIIK